MESVWEKPIQTMPYIGPPSYPQLKTKNQTKKYK